MNKWLKHDLHQLKRFCAENGFETFRARIVEISLTATFYHLTAQKIVRVKTLTSAEYPIITKNFLLNCAE